MTKTTLDEQLYDARKKQKMYLELAHQEDMLISRLLKKKYPMKNVRHDRLPEATGNS